MRRGAPNASASAMRNAWRVSSRFTVTLSSMALFGHAITSRAMREQAGIDDAAFLRWLTRLLFEHLESLA